MKMLGFTEDFISSIKSLYKNDSFDLQNLGLKSKKLFGTKGLRQGCSLSPLLFAIYIADMGDRLLRHRGGFQITGVHINSIFFADDIILITRSNKLMQSLIELLIRECSRIQMTVSQRKSQVINSEDSPVIVTQDDDNITLEAVLNYKYLGLNIYKTVFKTNIEKQKLCISKSKKYKGVCLMVSKSSVDVTVIASTLWNCVAIPSILNAAEFIEFSDTTIKELNSIQSALAKSVLGLPQNAPNFVAQTELGWPHMGERIWTVQLNALNKLVKKQRGTWAHSALLEHLSGNWHSRYLTYINKIKSKIQLFVLGKPTIIKQYVSKFYKEHLIHKINSQNLPYFDNNISLKRADYVSEHDSTALISGIKVGYPSGFKTAGTDRHRLCPACNCIATEFHVLWQCPVSTEHRTTAGIDPYKSNFNGLHQHKIYQLYIDNLINDDIFGFKSVDKLEAVKNLRQHWGNNFEIRQ